MSIGKRPVVSSRIVDLVNGAPLKCSPFCGDRGSAAPPRLANFARSEHAVASAKRVSYRDATTRRALGSQDSVRCSCEQEFVVRQQLDWSIAQAFDAQEDLEDAPLHFGVKSRLTLQHVMTSLPPGSKLAASFDVPTIMQSKLKSPPKRVTLAGFLRFSGGAPRKLERAGE